MKSYEELNWEMISEIEKLGLTFELDEKEIDLLENEEKIVKLLKEYQRKVIRKELFRQAKFRGKAEVMKLSDAVLSLIFRENPTDGDKPPYDIADNPAAMALKQFHSLILRLGANIKMQETVLYNEYKRLFRIVLTGYQLLEKNKEILKGFNNGKRGEAKKRNKKTGRLIKTFDPRQKLIYKAVNACTAIESEVVRYNNEMNDFAGKMRFAETFRLAPRKIFRHLNRIYGLIEYKNERLKEAFQISNYEKTLVKKMYVGPDDLSYAYREVAKRETRPY